MMLMVLVMLLMLIITVPMLLMMLIIIALLLVAAKIVLQGLMTVLVHTAWSHCFEECLPRVCSAESLFLCPLLTKTLLHVLLLHLLLFILIYLHITVVSIPPDAFYLLRHTPRLSFISPR